MTVEQRGGRVHRSCDVVGLRHRRRQEALVDLFHERRACRRPVRGGPRGRISARRHPTGRVASDSTTDAAHKNASSARADLAQRSSSRPASAPARDRAIHGHHGVGVAPQCGFDVGEAQGSLGVGEHDHVVDVGHHLACAVQRLIAAGHREQAAYPRPGHPLERGPAAPGIDDVHLRLAGHERPQRAEAAVVDVAAAARQQADARRDVDGERRHRTERQFLRRSPLGDPRQIGRGAQHHAEIAGEIHQHHLAAGALGAVGRKQRRDGVADAALRTYIGIDH